MKQQGNIRYSLKKSLWLILMMVFAISLNGQNRQKREADRYYKLLAYARAIDLYEKSLEKEYNPDAVLKLADCYRLTNQYEKAAEWYGKAMTIENKSPEMVFHYGHLLLTTGDQAAARQRFLEFSRLVPEDPRGRAFAELLANTAPLMQDSGKYEISLLEVNSDASDFGPVPYGGGLIFASSRKSGIINREFDWLEAPFLNLVHAKRIAEGEEKFEAPQSLEGEINTRFHESNFTWCNGCPEVFFTRNNYFQSRKGASDEGVILLKIYSAVMDGLEAVSIEEFPHNSDEYSVGHPTLSRDGKTLIFVSDMPGGEGGKDLYRCRKVGESWSEPENMGPEINTAGDEMFPFLHADGKLYFSSNGHAGLGNLDLFLAEKQAEGYEIRNMGFPVNSPYDDFAPWVDEGHRQGYFSSNRPGGAGDDDIYHFTLGGATVEVIVMDKIAQLPIENAQIDIQNLNDNSEFTLTTDSAGRILFPSDLGVDYDGIVLTEEFPDKQFKMNTHSEAGETFFSFLVELANPPPAISAIVIDAVTEERLPGSKIVFENLNRPDTTRRKADRNGRFAIKLGENTSYKLTVTHPGYLIYSDTVSTTENAYDGDTIIPLNMTKILFNKPIVLENIHYDFDMWFIRSDAIPDLQELVQLMNENPTIRIELSSHTDCRGSDPYNIVLSQKRATAAREYLLEHGIAPGRIVAKGYGETRLVNECDDGVDCTEDQHFANRRTEFRIIGYVEDIDQEGSMLVTAEDPDAPPMYIPETGRDNPEFNRLSAQTASMNDPDLPDRMVFEDMVPLDGKLVFRIQIGAFSAEIPEEGLKNLFEYRPFTFKVEENGLFKYMVGDYFDFAAAKRARNHLTGYGYKDAMVLGWKDGVVISPQELKRLTGQ